MLPEAAVLLEHIRAKAKPSEVKLCERAAEFAERAHGAQQRKSGELYITHPIAAAQRLWDLYCDPDMTAAALLHDVVEDTAVTRDEVYHEFGDMVGFMVDAVSKGFTDFQLFPKDPLPDRIERLLWASMQDVRVLLVKLADREHNLATLHSLPDHKQVRMSFETQAIYTPLRAILRYGTPQSTTDAQKLLQAYLKERNITTPVAFKRALIGTAFANVDEQLFDSYYKDTGSIVWTLESYDQYAAITDHPTLSQEVQFLRVDGGADYFRAYFTFHKGAVLEHASMQAGYYRTS